MAIEVILPRVDMDMATGTISKWHVKDGDRVARGMPLFEIETDKSAMEIESPGDGVIKLAGTGAGTPIPVGTIVAMIYYVGETPAAPVSRLAAAMANPAYAKGPAATAVQEAPESPVTNGIRATPLARRLAREAGLALTGTGGSGPRGRIVAEDIRSRLEPVAGTFNKPGDIEFEPRDAVRSAVAGPLAIAKQAIPCFHLSVTCNIDRLLALRERLNASAPRNPDKSPQWAITVNDVLLKALAKALQLVPSANVTFTDGGIRFHNASDVAVAIAAGGGMFTPVLRAVESKTLSQISREMRDLADRANARKLRAEEFHGGTTAISNLGMFGIEQFTANIHPTHATALAVGAGIERFVPVNGQPVITTQIACMLAGDHRVIDEAVGAELLAAFRAFVEEPALMLV